MAKVSIRDLRNHGGEVVDRVIQGESVTVTRAGKEVAQLSPVCHTPLSAETLLARWRLLPVVDPTTLRDDIDTIIDNSI